MKQGYAERAFRLCFRKWGEEKTVDNRFFEEVTEIRSVSREAMPRGEGDYISGRERKTAEFFRLRRICASHDAIHRVRGDAIPDGVGIP